MTLVAGVDLGLSGAIAGVEAEERRLLFVWDMPTYEVKVGKKLRGRIDLHKLLECMQTLADLGCALAAVEQPGYRKGNMGAGTVGYGFGLVHMALFATQPPIRTEIIASGAWKAALRVPAAKEGAVQRATAIFPNEARKFYGSRGGIQDGRAEAAMLALFGAQRFLNIRTT